MVRVFSSSMRSLLTCLATGLCTSIMAQAYFSKTYGHGPFQGGAVTPSGGLILNTDNGLRTTDAEGVPIWSRDYLNFGVNDFQIYDTTSYWAIFKDVAPLGTAGYVAVGRALPSVTTYRTNQALVGVFDTSGTPLWAGTHGGVLVEEYTFANAEATGTALIGGWDEGLANVSGLMARVGATYAGNYSASAYCTAAGMFTFILDGVPLANGDALFGGCGVNGAVVMRSPPGMSTSWCRSYALPDALNYTGVKLAEAPDGSLYAAAGPLNQGFALLRMDASGNALWSHEYTMGVTGTPTGIAVRPNGKVLVTGTTWMMQCDSLGAIDWARQYDGHWIRSLETVPGADEHYLVGSTFSDLGWVMRPDTSGLVLGCSISNLSASYTVINPVISTNCSNAPNAFGPGDEHHHFAQGAGSSSSVDCFSTGSGSIPDHIGIGVHPNPANGMFYLRCDVPITTGDDVELRDLHGRLVRTLRGFGSYEISIVRGDLPAGIYSIRVLQNGSNWLSARVVLE